ncbi:MAG TPA: SRPBCC domain-containing protein [Candidatus Limnocylindrales bacterium]|nr:SRPBCC domain-containing protein [Candidatus Limnocylindrales bacterium]
MSAHPTTTDATASCSGELRYDIRIEAPPELVWRFWTEPDRLVRWMGKVAAIEPRPGGAFRLEYGSGDVAVGSYVEVDPPRRLVFTWGWDNPAGPVGPGWSRVEVDLEPLDDDSATRLRLRHLGLPEESRSGHDEGWQHFLARLANAIAAADAQRNATAGEPRP